MSDFGRSVLDASDTLRYWSREILRPTPFFGDMIEQEERYKPGSVDGMPPQI